MLNRLHTIRICFIGCTNYCDTFYVTNKVYYLAINFLIMIVLVVFCSV